MRTSVAEAHGYVCPECEVPLSQDPSGKGHVRHLWRGANYPCPYDRGRYDEDGRDS